MDIVLEYKNSKIYMDISKDIHVYEKISMDIVLGYPNLNKYLFEYPLHLNEGMDIGYLKNDIQLNLKIEKWVSIQISKFSIDILIDIQMKNWVSIQI